MDIPTLTDSNLYQLVFWFIGGLISILGGIVIFFIVRFIRSQDIFKSSVTDKFDNYTDKIEQIRDDVNSGMNRFYDESIKLRQLIIEGLGEIKGRIYCVETRVDIIEKDNNKRAKGNGKVVNY